MQYINLGLRPQITKHLKLSPSHAKNAIDALDISLNIDGLPLFKSSSKTLWPVLCMMSNLKSVKIFPVVLTLGKSKPENLIFLQDIAGELNDILQNVMCDAPAKAFVKSIKVYSG